MSRAFVCRCEDVTRKDIEQAFARGHRHLEEVKRYTGFGTGPCQGKECHATAATLLRELQSGQDPPAFIEAFTSRPPIAPLTFRAAAGAKDLPHPTLAPPLRYEPEHDHAPTAKPLPATADVVIVGGGIMGLGVAYELAKQTRKRIVVLEKAYPNYGASGRNGGGIRLQWSGEFNIRVMQESLELFRSFAGEMGINIWLRQGGYLFLARSEEARSQLEKSTKLQNGLGVPTRMLDPREIHRIVPEIDLTDVVAAAYNPRDGVIFPWPLSWGYARAAERLGVEIYNFTPVTAIRRDDEGVSMVVTKRGDIETRMVLAATGAWTPEIAHMLGVGLPTWSLRHEICSSEPLKPWLKPLVSDVASGLYFSQSMRGEIVGGIAMPEGLKDERVNLSSRLLFLREYSRAILHTIPKLASVKILRQWSGPYDLSPDGHPILGATPSCPGFWVCGGFAGHGFMMAPAVAKHLAAAMSGHARHEMLHTWRPGRFAAGELLVPETMHLG